MSSLTLPERFLRVCYLLKVHLPLKSMIIGLFAALVVLRTRTALATGEVVVCGTVEVVTAGDVVVSKHE